MSPDHTEVTELLAEILALVRNVKQTGSTSSSDLFLEMAEREFPEIETSLLAIPKHINARVIQGKEGLPLVFEATKKALESSRDDLRAARRLFDFSKRRRDDPGAKQEPEITFMLQAFNEQGGVDGLLSGVLTRLKNLSAQYDILSVDDQAPRGSKPAS